jgi:hypothetical protein
VCGTTGWLEYGRVPGLDVFPSEATAVAHLKARGLYKQATLGCAVLGCGTFGDTAVTLIARKVRAAAVLPNGHEVLTVVEAQWIRVTLRNPAAVLTREERANVQSLTEIPLENLYFYCETFDVTRAFAHSGDHSLADPDREWVWNERLSAPLRGLGIACACPALLQGLVESRCLKDATGKDWRMAVFGRRSSMHPGTRYLARGLNASAAPGNEVEMEQLVWRKGPNPAAGAVVTGGATAGGETAASLGDDANGNDVARGTARANGGAGAASASFDGRNTGGGANKHTSYGGGEAGGEGGGGGGEGGGGGRGASAAGDGGVVRWSSYVWRRGSVPIRWGQTIKQSIGKP